MCLSILVLDSWIVIKIKIYLCQTCCMLHIKYSRGRGLLVQFSYPQIAEKVFCIGMLVMQAAFIDWISCPAIFIEKYHFHT